MTLPRALPRTASRRGTCTFCSGPVKPPRQTWCSQACVDEYLIRRSPGSARCAVWDRDHGRCAGCGTWTETTAAALATIIRRARSEAWPVGAPGPAHAQALLVGTGAGLTVRQIETAIHPCGGRCPPLWQADHVVPVVEGGGGCGLDNLRTLCLRCHKQETAALARRRARSSAP